MTLDSTSFMNWYYKHRIGLDVKSFWISILSFSKALIIPLMFGFVINRAFVITSYLELLLLATLYSIIYCYSMWKFGLNAFEKELRRQEPDTYYWEPDEAYRNQLEKRFDDERFNTALSFIAIKEDKVIGRIDASLISSRSDASCFSAYMDWICVLKSERHNKVAQALLNALRDECKNRNVGVLIALMANNDEAKNFYKSVENASMHDTGIWIDI